MNSQILLLFHLFHSVITHNRYSFSAFWSGVHIDQQISTSFLWLYCIANSINWTHSQQHCNSCLNEASLKHAFSLSGTSQPSCCQLLTPAKSLTFIEGYGISINFFFTILKFFHYFKWFQVQHFYLSNTPVSHFLDHLIFNDLELCDHLEFFTLETMNFSLLLSFQLILLFPLYQCFNLIKTSLILLLFSQNVFPFPCLFSLHLIVNCFNLSDQYFHQILSPRYQLWIHPNVTELKGFAVWGVLFNKKKHSYH